MSVFAAWLSRFYSSSGTDMSTSVWTRLPAELVLHVLRLAAQDRQTCLALSRVSSWTRETVLPRLWATVVLRNRHDILRFRFGFENKLLPAPPSDDPFAWQFPHGPLVRSLWIARADGVDLLPHFFQHCPNIRHLATGDAGLALLLDPAHDLPSGQGLQLTVHGAPKCWPKIMRSADGWPSGVRSPLFDRVTHLHVAHFMAGQPLHFRRMLAHSLTHPNAPFPRLTHYAIPVGAEGLLVPGQEVQEAVSGAWDLLSATLEVMVLVFCDMELPRSGDLGSWMRSLRAKGDGVLFATARQDDVLGEWRESVDGGETIWDKAARQTREWEDASML
ncbi:hypothetical protein PLICRDRAFT_377324 [Plicaturopsis crispa FD-325 SS-3]|nr:hypothetical protein PLICRDRAFT_377324 [Plicaturopsis crispa FD-325 SS-3]